jgi:hypothetical protein
MRKVSEYRQDAKECRGLAKQSRSAEHRQMLQNIAATWESLANDRIRTAEGLERIANRTEEPLYQFPLIRTRAPIGADQWT